MRTLFIAALFLLLLTTPALPGTSVAEPPPSGLRELWVIAHDGMSPAEQVLAQTLQGLVAGKQPKIWLRSRSMYAVVEGQLRREGVKLHEAGSVWELVRQFRQSLRGVILYRLGTPSLNVATSLCGPMGGVAIDESLLPRAEAEGLKVLLDARGMAEWEVLDRSGLRQALNRHGSSFARGTLVEQTIRKPGYLRDFAVARHAFTYFATDPVFRAKVLGAFGPNPIVYGWGDDEYRWVSDLSRADATGVAADFCLNLSALEKLPAGKLRRPARPAPEVEDGVRYVAFVMTDGDNVQWLCGNFVDHRDYWASPLRGKFPMTWEVSPLLAEVAPRVLQYLYATAKETDGFVAGAGVPGYTYLHLQPDPVALARQAAPLLRRSDLPVVSVINANAGSLAETVPLLDRPEVQGVLYKDYSPYHGKHGAIFWHHGKPCLSYRFELWERLMSPEQVASGVAQMPPAPRTDEGSYALINVHAWSYGRSGGPMEAVRRTIALLPPNTRLVTADQLIALLRKQFGQKHAKA